MRKFFMFLFCILLGPCLVGMIPSPTHATQLFSEDFESDLSNWTGKNEGEHHGQIMDDPLVELNHALNFTQSNYAGDIFTSAAFSTTGHYTLEFDYLGDITAGGTPDDLGGFIGYSVDLLPGDQPGDHMWLAGTDASYDQVGYVDPTSGSVVHLVDDGEWHHYSISFNVNASTPIHIMIEDYHGWTNGSEVGDAYFDNISLENTSIPEPFTMLLICSGLIGLAVFSKKLRKR